MTTLKGSCLTTDEVELISYLGDLPERGLGEWARLLDLRWDPLVASFDVSDVAAKSDAVRVALGKDPLPKPPGPATRPPGGYRQNLDDLSSHCDLL